MKRLTEKRDTPLVMSMWPGDSQSLRIYNRLAAIEDILGDEYDLDRLRELVEADKTLKEFAEDVARQFGYHGTTADGERHTCLSS